ncbi:MAG: conjugal transfer protein TraW [Pseudomonadota bacterium]
MSTFVSIAISSVLTLSQAASGDIGATYPIVEPDALAEMEEAAADKSVSIEDFGDSDGWSATTSTLLPIATADRIRDVIPFFTLPFDIPDGKGGLLYPAGFTFNPLEHLTLPNTLWFVREENLDWAFAQADASDMVIVSGGNALKIADNRGRPVYALQAELVDRLKLQAVPARVWQQGGVLKIQEIDAARIERWRRQSAPKASNIDADSTTSLREEGGGT